MRHRVLLVVVFSMAFSFQAWATSLLESDSTRLHYRDLSDQLNLRFYFSHKFTEFQLGKDMPVYEPNSGLHMGLGISFQKLIVNLAIPWGFLNPTRQKDWKRNIDLQLHSYTKYWNFDFFGQFYNGYILVPDQSETQILREDVEVRKFGGNAEYVFGGDRISMAAAKDQSQLQLRSAISPMAGFGIYRVRISGDSLFKADQQQVVSRGDFFQFGPSLGVVGTLVFGKGFFLTGAFSGSYSLGYSEGDQNRSTQNWQGRAGYLFRGFAGYNHTRFSINVNYVLKNLDLAEISGLDPSISTGNYRLNFVYRIQPGPNFTRGFSRLNPVNILNRMFAK